ncbi:MAG: phytoene/squalene synthase family protein [Nocardioidaceae bacterium]
MTEPHHLSAAASYDAVAQKTAAVVIRSYSTSFRAASRLLAEPVRAHVRNVYALVRIADEMVDSPELGIDVDARSELLGRLEEETRQALLHGCSSNLVVHAFATTADTCGIGMDLIEPFFASMRTDLLVTAHDALSFEKYVYGSAEVVGLMCLRAFLVDGSGTAGYAELSPGAKRLGAAFQKVNFLRDLAEDQHLLGRSYFPGLVLDRFSDVQRDTLLDDIDADLLMAASVIGLLPTSSRRAVWAAHALFSELARRLRATPAAQIRCRRVSVPNAVKARLLARSFVGGQAR